MKASFYRGNQLSEELELFLIDTHQRYFTWSEQMTRDSFNNPLTNFLIGFEHQIPVAFISYQKFEGELEILQVLVLPAYRQKGWGKYLLGEAQKLPNVQSIFLEVRAGNYSAIRLYESQGMQLLSCRKHYYHNPLEDALIYQWEKED